MNANGKIVFKVEYINACLKANRRLQLGAFIHTSQTDKRSQFSQSVDGDNDDHHSADIKALPTSSLSSLFKNNATQKRSRQDSTSATKVSVPSTHSPHHQKESFDQFLHQLISDVHDFNDENRYEEDEIANHNKEAIVRHGDNTRVEKSSDQTHSKRIIIDKQNQRTNQPMKRKSNHDGDDMHKKRKLNPLPDHPPPPPPRHKKQNDDVVIKNFQFRNQTNEDNAARLFNAWFS